MPDLSIRRFRSQRVYGDPYAGAEPPEAIGRAAQAGSRAHLYAQAHMNALVCWSSSDAHDGSIYPVGARANQAEAAPRR
jgi:hypothetical protein